MYMYNMAIRWEDIKQSITQAAFEIPVDQFGFGKLC